MHPAIKIVTLVIVSIFLTQGGWATLLFTGALLLPFYIVKRELFRPAFKMLYRLKWFFISILLIYYFYTPTVQQADLSILVQFSEQLTPGLFRILVLIFILFSVNLFIRTTPKEEILSALLWISSPLNFFNFQTERISLRAVLTLEYIEILSKRLTQYKIDYKSFDKSDIGTDNSLIQRKKFAFLHLIKYSGIILREILEEAEATSGQAYTIEYLEPPEFVQYFFPIVLCVFFYLSLI